MRRNTKAARHLLEAVEEHADANGMDHFQLISLCGHYGYSQNDWQYAYRILENSGYLHAENGTVQMTWDGHELLGDLAGRT